MSHWLLTLLLPMPSVLLHVVDASFRYLTADKRSAFYKLTHLLGRWARQHGTCHDLLAFATSHTTRRMPSRTCCADATLLTVGRVCLRLAGGRCQELLFSFFYTLFAFVTMLPAYLWFRYEWANFAYVCIVVIVAVWNGANFYVREVACGCSLLYRLTFRTVCGV